MGAITDLLRQIPDAPLRERLTREFKRLNKNKQFGLVFEEHIPECTPLYGVPIRPGGTAALKSGRVDDVLTVLKVSDAKALCLRSGTSEAFEVDLSDLIAVARFGDAIFPTLTPIAEVENAPEDRLWHTVIEAENYHALQLLEYLYPGQVDCIYIDPPYNTGARDWKYNNDYVDSNDNWRHSKWLSMMQRRLRIAKRILNPDTGVLIVTIDEREVHHLGMLLEREFREAHIQMATIVINQKGVSQGRLARTEEHAMFVFMPNAYVPVHFDDLLFPEGFAPGRKQVPRWERLLRGGTDSRREDSPSLFYPIYVDPEKKKIIGVGDVMPLGQDPDLDGVPEQTVAWPIRKDGSYGRWQVSPSSFMELVKLGMARLGGYDRRRRTWTVLYLNRGTRKRIQDGEITIVGRDPITNVVQVEFASPEAKLKNIKTVWHRSLHDSGIYGSSLLSTIIGRDHNFAFPKSLYSTRDAIAAVVRDRRDALIVDFFAGSGTTLNAVNLLNAEDGGHRRCILVTNNEVSESEARDLEAAGFHPGDPEWESHGICRSVTWPRTVFSILGKRSDGTPLTGAYYTNQTVTEEKSRSFFQLGFVENPATLALTLKKQLVAILRDKNLKQHLPSSLVKADTRYIVSAKHTASILFDPEFAEDWITELEGQDQVTDFYIMAREKSTFNRIKARITEELGPYQVSAPLKRPMSDGFATNAEYFKLDFLDKDSVTLGQQFFKILPLLWLKSGAIGRRPRLDGDREPDMMVLPENGFAVLIDETKFAEFLALLAESRDIRTVYFVTNSDEAFREMSSKMEHHHTYQLYRDYLDNFVLGARRDSQ